MDELTTKWRKIFDEISIADNHIKGTVNYYNLTSILEDLYIENAELKARVEKLEKDTQPWTHPESGFIVDTSLDDVWPSEIKKYD